MQKLIFINGTGTQIDLTSGNFGITNWAGLSNTGLNIQTQQVPFEDGGVFLDALMEQREIEVTVAIYDGNNLELRYQKKRELISALNPKLGEGTLIYTNDYLSRQIKAVPQIPLFENKNSNDAGTLKASVAFSCPSPYWEDVEPISKPILLGVIETVENEGDIPTEMEIDFYIANSTNPKIQNLTIGKAIQLNGTFNDNIHININMGKKTVDYNKMSLNYINPEKPKTVYYSQAFDLYIILGSDDPVYTSKDLKYWKNVGNVRNGNAFIDDTMIYITGEYYDLKTTDGINWTSINPIGLKKIIYSKNLNKYIGISYANGGIKTSSDFDTWTEVYSGGFTDICNSENLICAISSNNKIYVSSDGENWIETDLEIQFLELKSIVYAKELNIFCVAGGVVGQSGKLITSTDGLMWNIVDVGNEKFKSVTYLAGIRTLFATTDNNLYKSVNGFNWYIVNVEEGDKGYVSVADYALYLPCGDITLRSTDGENFEESLDNHIIKGVAYSKKLGIYCGYVMTEPYSYHKIYYSYDCIHWIKTFTSTHQTIASLEAICYSEKIGMFVATGGGLIYYSADGINWNNATVEPLQISIDSMCVSEKLGMFVGTGDQIIVNSTDGINWNIITLESATVYNLCYSEKLGLFCGDAYSRGRKVATSTDGINWTFTAIEDERFEGGAICKSEKLGAFIIANTNIWISADGINWSFVKNIQESQHSYYIASITYSEELGLFCGIGTGMFISPDGINWILKEDVNGSFVTYNTEYGAFYFGTRITTTENIINIISTLDKGSDMSLNLVVGKNNLLLTQESGGLSGRILYRQKYIGV